MNAKHTRKTIRFLTALLAVVLTLSAAACTAQEASPNGDGSSVPAYRSDAGAVLCLSPSVEVTPEFVREKTGTLPDSLLFTSTTSVAVSCLLDGTGDSLFTLAPVAEFYASRSEGLEAEIFETGASLSMLVSKDKAELADRLSELIRRFKSDGTIVDLYETWIAAYAESGRPENADEPPTLPLFEFTSDGEFPETIRIGVSGTIPLIDYLIDDGVAGGFTAAFASAIATELEANVQFVSVLPEAKISALLDDKIDVYFWHFLDVPDVCVATEPYLTVYYALLHASQQGE